MILDTLIAVVEREAPADQKSTVAPMLRQLLSPETMIATAAGDAQIYLSLNGVELADGERARVPLQTAMRFGGGSMPSVLTAPLT